jgi:hypothetical protein
MVRDNDIRLPAQHPAVRARIFQWKARLYTRYLVAEFVFRLCRLRLKFIRFKLFTVKARYMLIKAFNRSFRKSHGNS